MAGASPSIFSPPNNIKINNIKLYDYEKAIIIYPNDGDANDVMGR
jgi:hypothetical protein